MTHKMKWTGVCGGKGSMFYHMEETFCKKKGVAILFSPGLDVDSHHGDSDGQGCSCQRNTTDHSFCLYPPNQGPHRLRQVLQQCDQNECVVMGGVWKCILDSPLDRTGEEPHAQSPATLLRVIAEAG